MNAKPSSLTNSLILTSLITLALPAFPQVSSNKLLVVGTNNVLRADATNFFTTNIFPLTNALAAAGYGTGGGGVSPPFSANFDTNGASKVDLATTISPTNAAIGNTLTVGGLATFAGPSIVVTNNTDAAIYIEGSAGWYDLIRFAYGGPLAWTIGGLSNAFEISDNVAARPALSFASVSDAATFASSVAADGISNAGWEVVAGSETNSNTISIFLPALTHSDWLALYSNGVKFASVDSNGLFRAAAGSSTDVAFGQFADLTNGLWFPGSNRIAFGNLGALAGEWSNGIFYAYAPPIFNDSSLTNAAGQSIASASVATNVATSNGLVTWAGTNFVHGQNGRATNLTETATFTATNISSASHTMQVGDGNGDYFWVDDVNGQVGLFNDGNVSAQAPSSVILDLNGNFDMNLSGGFVQITNGSFRYTQQTTGSFLVEGVPNGTVQETADFLPASLTNPFTNDLVVATGGSNLANVRLQADGTVSAAGYWQHFTNISANYSATLYDRIILANPGAGSLTVTLPGNSGTGLVLPTGYVNTRAWAALDGWVGGGTPKEAVWMTLDYTVVNIGSNTANTLSVVLPNPATNIGLSTVLVPTGMSARFYFGGTNGGTNIIAEFIPNTLSPEYNLANCTNLPAAQLSGTVPGSVLPALITNAVAGTNIVLLGWTNALSTNLSQMFAGGNTTNLEFNCATNNLIYSTVSNTFCITNIQGLSGGYNYFDLFVRNTNTSTTFYAWFATGLSAAASGPAAILNGGLTNQWPLTNSTGYYHFHFTCYGTNYLTNAVWECSNPGQ